MLLVVPAKRAAIHTNLTFASPNQLFSCLFPLFIYCHFIIHNCFVFYRMALLETERLLISPITTSDAAFIIKLVNDPSWLQYIGDRNVKSLDDARRYIEQVPLKSYEENGFGPYKIVLKNTNTAIGMCGLLKRDRLDDVDIGFALLDPYTGHGYAYEATASILTYAQRQLGLPRIVAITSADNVRSLTLLQKLGLRFERTLSFYDRDALLLGIDFPK